MTPGLVNSVIHCAVLPPAGAVIQAALFQDDTARVVADLEQRLRESDGAYQALSDAMAELETEHRRVLHELAIAQQQARDLAHVAVFGLPGRVVR